MRHTKGLLLTTGLCLALVGCDKGSSTDGGTRDGGVQTPDQGVAPPGLVTLKNAGEKAEFDTGEDFLVVPYSASEVAATAIEFSVTVEGGKGDQPAQQSKLVIAPTKGSLATRDPQLWARLQARLEVERWTRGLAERAAKLPLSRAPRQVPIAACATSSACAATEVCHQGTCAAQVKLNTDKFANVATIDVKVKLKGTKAAVLVDAAETLSDADAKALLDAFEVIYGRSVALFGNPPLKAGEATLSSDRNADGLVWLVLTKHVADKKKAVGFFVATDFTDEAGSNKADILYVATPDAGKVKDVYSTLAHELQHLLGYGAKVYRAKVAGGQGALEALWLDEGLSHFAEDACGYGAENVVLLDQELFPTFGDISLYSGKDTLGMRAMAMTFVRYLFERKGGVDYDGSGGIQDRGGAAWLASLRNTDKQGAAAITATFGDVKAAIGNWLVAVALDGRGLAEFPFSYRTLIDDPLTKNKIGVKIRGKRIDHTGATVDLKGPLEEALDKAKLDATVTNASARFYLLKGQRGKVSISVSSKDADFRFAVLKLK